MLNKCKLALLISSNTFDTEITDLISAAVIDLNIAGVNNETAITTTPTDALVERAIISFVCYNFELVHGSLDRSEAFKRIYDEQKSQLSMADGYTTW